MTERDLIKAAFEAQKLAYTPVSGFNVGAALLSKSGKIYHGCNIEVGGLSPSLCAERTAFAKAISEGEIEFEAIAIVGGRENEPVLCPPCGVCRQFMLEFCHAEDFKIIFAKSEEEYKVASLAELLPFRFERVAGK